MGTLFKDVVTSGADMFAPSASQPPTRPYDDEDCYRPTINAEEEEDLIEGLGDSQDDSFGQLSAGVTAEFEGMNIQQNSQRSRHSNRSGSGILGKHIRDGGLGTKRKKKAPTSQKIASAFSQVAINPSSNARPLKQLVQKSLKKNHIPSVAELSLEIYALEEITCDPDLLTHCLNLLASNIFRELFATVVENRRQHVVDFLKYNAANPNPLFK